MEPRDASASKKSCSHYLSNRVSWRLVLTLNRAITASTTAGVTAYVPKAKRLLPHTAFVLLVVVDLEATKVTTTRPITLLPTTNSSPFTRSFPAPFKRSKVAQPEREDEV